MSVSGDRLGDAIKAFVDAIPDDKKGDLQYIWRGIASEILSELTDNAVVTTDVDGTNWDGVIK